MIAPVLLVVALVAAGALVEWAVRRSDARASERAAATHRLLNEMRRHQ